MSTNTNTTTSSWLRGGEFLVKESAPEQLFIREEFSEEELMMFHAAQDFLKTEVIPELARFEQGDYALVESLMKKMGELGLLGISVPEAYGGLGLGFNLSMLICEEVSSVAGSLATAFGAHTGIGTLPILLYGSEELKMRFLPKISTGEWISCYNLTEPNAGSDANSGKTKALLSEDGTYYEITGQKIWISNAGFADVFIVFAKIEDDKNLTGFVLLKDEVEGLILNPEEHKLGLKSSSTRQVFYDKVRVPANQMLGERNGGFKIAVNALNVGRIKLAAATNGAAMKVISLAVNYANERKQFGQSISTFGAIQHKLAEMATRTWVTDAALYRAGRDIEDNIARLLESGKTDQEAKLKGIEEYSIECAILKVLGSEVSDYVIDEGLQIYGGMGFSADAPMEAAYRDARISRIYEGTNEINRMLIVNMLLKKAMSGKLNLTGPAMAVAQELMSIPDFSGPDESILFDEEKRILKNFKKAALLVSGAAVQKLMMTLSNEQEILMHTADMVIQIYAFESALLKAEKLILKNGQEASSATTDMMRIYMHHASEIINHNGKEALMAFTDGDEQRMMLMGLKRFTKVPAFNLKEARRRVAANVIEANQYCF